MIHSLNSSNIEPVKQYIPRKPVVQYFLSLNANVVITECLSGATSTPVLY